MPRLPERSLVPSASNHTASRVRSVLSALDSYMLICKNLVSFSSIAMQLGQQGRDKEGKESVGNSTEPSRGQLRGRCSSRWEDSRGLA